MTRALFILSFMVFTFHSQAAGFRDAKALRYIIATMNEASSDLNTFYRLSDKKYQIPQSAQCLPSSSQEAYDYGKKAIDHFIEFYSDEDLPYDQALGELAEFLSFGVTQKCRYVVKNRDFSVDTNVFISEGSELNFVVEQFQRRP